MKLLKPKNLLNKISKKVAKLTKCTNLLKLIVKLIFKVNTTIEAISWKPYSFSTYFLNTENQEK